MQRGESITGQLSFGARMPSLPQALVRLLEVCNDPEVEIEKIAEIVGQDVAVTAKILKLANSAFIGSRSKFHSIDQAVIYLGRDTVRNLAISVSVHETFQGSSHPSSRFNRKEFWYHSLLTALLAKEIAELCGLPNPAEFYLAGLLHDIGKCLINQSFPGPYGKILVTCETVAEQLQEERTLCGMSHAETGALLAQHWNLAEPLVQAIGRHHLPPSDRPDNQTLALITALANLLAVDHQDMHSLILQTASRLQIAPDMLLVIRAEQQENVFAVAESLGIAIEPLSQPESTDPAEKHENRLTKKVAALAQVHGMLDNLIKAQTINRVLQVLEESLHILFDIEKCVLLLPDQKTSVLVAKGSFRNHFARELRGFKIPLESPNAPFSRILENRKIADITPPTPVIAGCPEAILLDTFEEKSLLALPFAMSSTERGILIFAANQETPASLLDIEESLLFLVAHVGSRLHLEGIKRRHAEALAREQITTMQETARALAHEIASPLAIVGNYLTLLHNRPDVTGDIRADLQIIGNELERIGNISRQLNNLAISPAPGSKEPVDIQVIITSTVQLLRKSMPIGKNVCLKTEKETALPLILTHRQALQQILLNLLGNSLDAVGTGGWVRVQCRYLPAEDREHGEIVIEVADNGPGIAPANIDRLFQAGYTTKGPGHAGLGLAIVKKLTADLQGRILHSIGEDGETRFLLYLPATKEATTRP